MTTLAEQANATQSPADLVGMNGMIDEQQTLPLNAEPFAAPPPEEAIREVKIRVPTHIPDNVVLNAFQLGIGILQRMGGGLLISVFPAMAKGPDGKPVPAIGKQEMLIAKPEDIIRIRELMRVIHETNLKVLQSPNAVAAATAAIEGTKAKDEALRKGISAAGGEVPLEVAKVEPQGKFPRAVR